MVDTNDPATILPAATTQEGDALIGALRLLNDGGYSRAETHLREAGVQINAGRVGGVCAGKHSRGRIRGAAA